MSRREEIKRHILAARLRQHRCPGCHQPIDFSRRYPDPLSASIDHTLPKSVFGENGPTRWMHLRCNQEKGTKLPADLASALSQLS